MDVTLVVLMVVDLLEKKVDGEVNLETDTSRVIMSRVRALRLHLFQLIISHSPVRRLFVEIIDMIPLLIMPFVCHIHRDDAIGSGRS